MGLQDHFQPLLGGPGVQVELRLRLLMVTSQLQEAVRPKAGRDVLRGVQGIIDPGLQVVFKVKFV